MRSGWKGKEAIGVEQGSQSSKGKTEGASVALGWPAEEGKGAKRKGGTRRAAGTAGGPGEPDSAGKGTKAEGRGEVSVPATGSSGGGGGKGGAGRN